MTNSSFSSKRKNDADQKVSDRSRQDAEATSQESVQNLIEAKQSADDGNITPRKLMAVQRTLGNQAAQRLLSTASRKSSLTVGSVQRDPPPAAAPPAATPVARPSLAELRTIATSAINAEYYGAARDALNDFENVMAPDFDWGTFFTNQVGNMIWAVACFSTGGTAFLISTAGIALAAGATASAVSSRSDFHQQTVNGIDQQLIQPMLNRVDTVTRDIDSTATQNNWDDNETRRRLLERLLRPEYITSFQGGFPAVNRQAIRTRMTNDLITAANAFRPGVTAMQDPGEFVYYYEVSNHIDSGGFLTRGELYAADHLRPPSSWTFRLTRVALKLPQGGSPATRAMTGELHPATMPFTKRLSIVPAGGSILTGVAVTTNASNQFAWIGESYGIFEQIWPAPPARLGTHFSLGGDPNATGAQILQQAWRASGGLPPNVTNPQPFSSYW